MNMRSELNQLKLLKRCGMLRELGVEDSQLSGQVAVALEEEARLPNRVVHSAQLQVRLVQHVVEDHLRAAIAESLLENWQGDVLSDDRMLLKRCSLISKVFSHLLCLPARPA